jgi:hypothetical protein
MNVSMTVRRLCLIAMLVFCFAGTALAQATYPDSDSATAAFVQAVRAGDQAALQKVLGKNWKDYIPVEGIDRDDVDAFLKGYDESHKIVDADGKSHLAVGKEDWILPIPLVKDAGGWHFDVNGAREEIRVRRIGNNELATMQAMLAYYDAQRDYASRDRNGDNVLEYAQRLVSSSGKQDGLYWPLVAGGEESPLGPAFADTPPGDDFHGYHYRILTGQGPSAPGGAYGYIVGKRMTNGFALVAWPARYGDTGVMSFMISHDGEIFEKDLGKDGAKTAQAMQRFDPDSSWQEAKPVE